MKKVFIAMGAVAAMACSCAKEEFKSEEIPMQEGNLHISLVNDQMTKATGDGHTAQADDNNINTLEIFIFRVNEGGVDDGLLDAYKKFTAEDLKTLPLLSVKTTTGKKMVYVIANSHVSSWGDNLKRSAFEEQMAFLQNDNVKDFIMFAGKDITVELESTISMALTRMVSRVKLNSVKVSFAGTPNEGTSLQNVKAYLTNVQAQKLLLDGSGKDLKLLNSKKYVAEDVTGFAMQGMLYDELAESISETTYNTPHYFYCYENSLTEETESDRFTKLVIEGTLNGVTYYYPVPIKDLKRNSCYTIDVRIYRPGSLDPETAVEVGSLDFRLNIQGWNTLPGSTVEF